MGKFDGILICSDLDGTLLRNNKTISDENIEAIEYFMRNGGYFTFVTGRMPSFVSHINETIHPNAPIGCINGGGLYDYTDARYIFTAELPKTVIPLIQKIEETFSNVGIQVNTFDTVYFCRENRTMSNFRSATKLPNIVKHYKEIPETFAKIVFGSESNEVILDIESMLHSHKLAEQFDFVRSEHTLFEILPKGISKGTSIIKLAEYLHINLNKTIAIGDYNNDIPMFRAAGCGIAVANACREALDAADMVTVSNEEHAIAQVIKDVENRKYAL